MRNTYFIQITKKRNAHMLFEKTAEIFPAESYLISYFFQREFFGVMFIYISNNLSQSIIRLTSARSRSRQGIYRKITNQISKHQQCRAVRTHGAGAFAFYVGSCQIMSKLTEVNIVGRIWIIQRKGVAFDMIQLQIRAVYREPFLIDVDTKEHIEVRIRMYGMYFFGIKNN